MSLQVLSVDNIISFFLHSICPGASDVLAKKSDLNMILSDVAGILIAEIARTTILLNVMIVGNYVWPG